MRNLLAILCLLLATVASLPAQGKTFMTTQEALALAFPECKIERQRHVLNDPKKKVVLKLSGEKAPRSMIIAYRATKKGKVVGTAYFDRHRVRSQRELLMIVVDANDKVRRIEVISFGEPTDYIPRGNFYREFVGKGLKDKLSTKGSITPVVGSTLTVNATANAVRRVLATHQVLFPKVVTPSPTPVAQKVAGKGKPVANVTIKPVRK